MLSFQFQHCYVILLAFFPDLFNEVNLSWKQPQKELLLAMVTREILNFGLSDNSSSISYFLLFQIKLVKTTLAPSRTAVNYRFGVL